MGIFITIPAPTPAPPVPPVDLLVGRTLFVSTEGLGGLYQNLTDHYNDINAAIADLISPEDVIVVHPNSVLDVGTWTISANAPDGIGTLNLFLHPGVSLVFSDQMTSIVTINIAGQGTVTYGVEMAASQINCSALNISFADIIGTVSNVVLNLFSLTEINFVGVLLLSPYRIRATAISRINFTELVVADVGAILVFTAPDLTGLINIDNVSEEDIDIRFYGNYSMTSLGTSALTVTGAGNNLSSSIRFYGNITYFGNRPFATITDCTLQFQGYYIKHQNQVDNVGTSTVPIFLTSRTSALTGLILKGVNIQSANAQRLNGIVASDNALNYLQVDAPTFADLDGTITGSPDVYTSPIGTTFNGLSASYTNNFLRFFNPLTITNNFVAGTALLARLANFQN